MATNNELNLGNTPLPVTQGGIGIASTVAYAPICGGTSSTSALQSVASVGSSGDILTSQGSNLPVFLSGLGVSPIIYTKVTVSVSDIKGMYVTPKLLVAAGGSNTLIYPLAAIFEKKFTTPSYTGGGNTYIQWDSTTLGAGTLASISSTAAIVGVTGSTDTSSYILTTTTIISNTSPVINKGLYLTNATAAFATGNSTCYVHLYYSILSTAI